MKALLLVLIRLYWRIFPEDRRRVCLYRQTCSVHSHAMLKDRGAIVGIGAFLERMQNCRGGYTAHFEDGRICIATVKGKVIQEEEINPFVLAGLRAALLPS